MEGRPEVVRGRPAGSEGRGGPGREARRQADGRPSFRKRSKKGKEPMSTPKEIYNEVKAILAANSVLGSYVNRIYERERDNLDGSKRTVVALEPSDVIEKSESYPLEATFVMMLTGYMIESDPDKSINDGSERKIMDLEQDIKNALRPYYNLNGKCIAVKFSEIPERPSL